LSIEIKKGKEWHLFTKDEKDDYKEKNQISAITGATISTNAVVSGIKKSIPKTLHDITSSQEQ